MQECRRPRICLNVLRDVDASTGQEVRRQLQSGGIDATGDSDNAGWVAEVVVCRRPGEPALTAVRNAALRRVARIVIISTGGWDGERSVWQLLQAGAADVLEWDRRRTAFTAACLAARLQRWCEVDTLVESTQVRDRLVGRSAVWIDAVRDVVEVAALPEVSVLITGESGTGKELAARLIHDLDPRPDKQELVLLDCTTIVPTLSGSEFFGHERGAFTDAVTARDGAFGEADRGTLFLDELGDLSPGLQAELLRVVQEGMYKRVGSSLWRHTRFRLICATNRDLRDEVARGRFRSDLYHRLAAWTVRLPSLRERPEDIPHLANFFLRQVCPGVRDPSFERAVLDVLQRRDYPGNARELRQLVSRISGRHVGPGPITVGDLPPEERPCEDQPVAEWRDDALAGCVRRALAGNATLREIRKAAEDVAIAVALAECGGSVRRASRQLHVTERALQMRRAAARKREEAS